MRTTARRAPTCAASAARTFDVSGIETNSIRAAYNNGVLTVTLPKRSAHRPEGQTITID